MIGKKIAQYKLIKELGHGPKATVFLAKNTNTNESVVFKKIHEELSSDFEARILIKNEVLSLSLLEHENILKIRDYVEEGENVGIVTDYTKGITLEEYFNKNKPPLHEEKIVDLLKQILKGLAYGHLRNIMHRDLRPSNILITPDEKIKILDFGLATIWSPQRQKPDTTNMPFKNIIFISPEQLKGDVYDERTDFYALGIILFFMLTGEYPYTEQKISENLYEIVVKKPLPNPRLINPVISEDMAKVVVKATYKNQDRRFLYCSEFEYSLSKAKLNTGSPIPPNYYEKRAERIHKLEEKIEEDYKKEAKSIDQQQILKNSIADMERKQNFQKEQYKKVSNHMGWAIITTLFCCPPLGIIAIVNAAKVNKRLTKGDVFGAKKASKAANNWALVATILGIGIYAFFIFAYIRENT